MTYKTVLLVIDANQNENDLTAAADLCAPANAHLSVLLVKLAVPPPLGEYAAMSVAWLDERAEDMQQLDKAVERVRATLKGLGISFDANGIYCETAWADDDVGNRARYADVTLIGASLKTDSPLRARAIDGALFYSARPVLLATNRQSVTLRPKKIVLAWNSTMEAARARPRSFGNHGERRGSECRSGRPKRGFNQKRRRTGCRCRHLPRSPRHQSDRRSACERRAPSRRGSQPACN
ncbi:hypothetical protein ABIE78_000572 [Sinorhizobium fredii]